MSRPLRRTLLLTVTSLILAAALTPLMAGNWPHWRGPNRDGTSTEVDLPLTWDGSTNVLWQLPLPGLSGSTPIVWAGRVFLNVTEGDAIQLWSIDRATGEPIWKRHLSDGNEAKRKGNLSSPSPVTDGERVWTVTGTGVVKAFDFAGEELWRHDLQREYGKFGILHGYSSSPLLFEDRLVIQVLHGFFTDDPSYLVALDKLTGERRWRVERPTDAPREAPDAYTTPALLARGGRHEIIVTGADYVTGHDPANGRELWRVTGLNPSANPIQRIVASPVVDGRKIYVPSRVRPLLALEAATSEGPPRRLWSMDKGPDVPTPALGDGRLYLVTDRGLAWALDTASGEPVWGPERVGEGTYSASPVVAAGRIYVTSEEGVTTVMSATDSFEILAQNAIGEYTLSSLAISDGQIFLRTADHLFCIGESDSAEATDSQATVSPSVMSPPVSTSP
jgi:outer membrane protein assembly factor BamB